MYTSSSDQRSELASCAINSPHFRPALHGKTEYKHHSYTALVLDDDFTAG